MKNCFSRGVLFSAILCSFAFSSTAFADRFGKDAIYVVDMQRVLLQCKQGASARSKLESDVKEQRQKLEKQGEQLKKQHEDLAKQAPLLSKTALEKKSQEYVRNREKFESEVANQTKEFERRKNALIEKIVNEAQVVIKQLVKEKGYRFVIERGQNYVVYMDDDLDLTDEVIERLDDRR